MTAPHQLRCETCKHRMNYHNTPQTCSVFNQYDSAIDERRLALINELGGASHHKFQDMLTRRERDIVLYELDKELDLLSEEIDSEIAWNPHRLCTYLMHERAMLVRIQKVVIPKLRDNVKEGLEE